MPPPKISLALRSMFWLTKDTSGVWARENRPIRGVDRVCRLRAVNRDRHREECRANLKCRQSFDHDHRATAIRTRP